MDFSTLNNKAMRDACKARHISYGGMSLAAMRDACTQHDDNAAALALMVQETEAAQAAAALQQVQDEEAAQAAAKSAMVLSFRSNPAARLETSEGETGFWVQGDEGPVWYAVPLSSLGEFGLGVDAASSRCPHCGIDHKDNGVLHCDDELPNDPTGRTYHQAGIQSAEWSCMGCNGDWGVVRAPYAAPAPQASRSTGTGLKIEKGRIERNGLKQPSLGGACRSVWDACTEMQALAPATPLKVALVKAHAATMQWNVNNAVIEFYRWKKWSAPTADEVQAAADADAAASRAAVAPEAPVAPEGASA